MGAQPRNERLADVMRKAGLSNKALARRVRELSQRRRQRIACDHTSVSRWLSGTIPRERTASLIVEVLSDCVGSPLTLDEVGLSASQTFDARLGLRYEGDVEVAVATLGTLWTADLMHVRTLLVTPANASAWSEASLSWLVRPDNSSRPSRRTDGGRVGQADVAAIRATTDAFAALDNNFGGGHARRALIQFLHSDLAGVLRGQYTEDVGKRVHAAAAETTLLAAWMSYDAGVHGLAQRYFVQALRLADAADDVLLAGSILDAMSHQATFLGSYREAANLARAAQSGTRGLATPGLTAHFHAMEARALSAGGDSVSAQRALSRAVGLFEKRDRGDDPDWISYFDEAELSNEFGHCFRDIGRSRDAAEYAERALSGASARSDFFATMVLAAGHLPAGAAAPGDLEQACAIAERALELGAQVKSARCVEYVRDFRQSLRPFATAAAVRTLADSARDHPLWLASGQAA